MHCDAADSRRAAFSYLAALHHRPCDEATPVVVHEWSLAGLGNALGTLLVSLHFAALHERTLVTTGEGYRSARTAWVWTNGTRLEPADVYWPSSCDRLAARSAGGVRIFRHSVRMRAPAACPAYGCAWANALPQQFEHLCVMTWYAHLTHFLLRPSDALTGVVQALGERACAAPGLCGADGRSARDGWLAERLRQHGDVERSEQAWMRLEAREQYRPPFAGSLAARLKLLPHAARRETVLALHVRAGDACGGARPVEQRPACVLGPKGLGPTWEARLRDFWDEHRGAPREQQRDATASLPTDRRRTGILLVSTDSDAAFALREQTAAAVGARAALGFALPRDKYDGSSFVESRVVAGRLDARSLLAEGLLDLGLLAQGDVLVGSMYSNFARIALQMRAARGFPYLSFDALWCPYHKCQAGCTDVSRLCLNPTFLPSSELTVGQRGNLAAGAGSTTLRVVAADEAAQRNRTHPARRAWLDLMLALRQAVLVNDTVSSAARRRGRAECQAAFGRAEGTLRTMPAVY